MVSDLFPHPSVRDGQRQFLEDCRCATLDGRSLVAHAPTGIGKTAAALSSALEAAIKKSKKVFFLTPKHTQHTIVVDTLKKIRERHNVEASVTDIIGKQWMCPHRVRDLSSKEFNEFCKARKKDETCQFYNNTRRAKTTKKAKQAIAKILREPLHNEEALKICAESDICPYEVLLEVARSSDVIVCDYFHVFSAAVRRAFMHKLDTDLSECILVVDEAHNLPDRLRSIMSNKLSTYVLDTASKEAKVIGSPATAEDLKSVGKLLRRQAKGLRQGQESYVERDEFVKSAEKVLKLDYDVFQSTIESLGEQVLKLPGRYRSNLANAAKFLQKWRGPDVGYARILAREGKNVSLSYRCLDCALASQPVFEQAYASILMSGTLTPIHMYSDVLGISDDETMECAYESPFPRDNRLTIVVPGLTTKFGQRSDYMYARYAKTISECLLDVPGNAAVFYPSYDLLKRIGSMVRTEKNVIAESQGLGKGERRRLMDRLIRDGGVLMGVQAGSFSEGLDFAGNLLDAVFIVGLPLERPNLVTQALIDYYDFRFERGWDYGYIYPAMNRSMQAAGRCIRSETDRGVIVLLDERFQWANYRKCLPPEYAYAVSEMPVKYLRRFFDDEALEAYYL